MARTLFIDATNAKLFDADGARFDLWSLSWVSDHLPDDAVELPAREALARVTTRRRLLPVGVIGPREGTAEQLETAELLGAGLAKLGIPVLCGGKSGVMEAVAKGTNDQFGLVIGLIPETEWQQANDHVTLPIATGIGKSRNVVIAQSAFALIAVGGQYGTMSEIAFGLHFDKPVLGLEGAPDLPGVRQMPDVEAALDCIVEILLARN